MNIQSLPFNRLTVMLLLVAAAAVPIYLTLAQDDSPVPVTELAEKTHFHGIAVDANDPTRLYLATHHGLYVVTPNGVATRISENQNDYMGFTPHPADPEVLYASGHPAGGGNMGVLISEDGGRTWRQIAEGVNGPVDFHQMDISQSNPGIMYGVYGGLQVSRDGGRTWEMHFKAPPKLFDLTVSGADPRRLYAATEGGLLISDNGGESWQPAHDSRAPATMVQAKASGDVYAFIAGLGLLRSPDGPLMWDLVSGHFNNGYLLHLAADPSDPDTLYVVTDKSELLKSSDGGGRWQPIDTN